jgi:Family of unknown function (DUF6527)
MLMSLRRDWLKSLSRNPDHRVKSSQVHLRARVQSRSEAASFLSRAGDMVLVDRRRRRWLLLQCPDGCGEIISLNLDPQSGPAWRCYELQEKITVYPSIWRKSGCRSHFIIWDNKVFGIDETNWPGFSTDLNSEIESKVPGILADSAAPVHYSRLADLLGVLPWTMLTICRGLQQRGLIAEMKGTESGTFQLLDAAEKQRVKR